MNKILIILGLLISSSCSLGLRRHNYGNNLVSAYGDRKLVYKHDDRMTYYYHKQNKFSCFPDGKWHGRIYTIHASDIFYALMFLYDLDSTYDYTKIETQNSYLILKKRKAIPENLKYEIAFCYLNYPEYGIDGLFFTNTFLYASVRFYD
jgi:hypothetical protein